MWNKDAESQLSTLIAIQHRADVTMELSIVTLTIYYDSIYSNSNFNPE